MRNFDIQTANQQDSAAWLLRERGSSQQGSQAFSRPGQNRSTGIIAAPLELESKPPSEPAIDLPLALSLASSKLKKPLPSKLVAIGELGLSGELRAISHLEKRLQEAEKLGFTDFILSDQLDINRKEYTIKIHGVLF